MRMAARICSSQSRAMLGADRAGITRPKLRARNKASRNICMPTNHLKRQKFGSKESAGWTGWPDGLAARPRIRKTHNQITLFTDARVGLRKQNGWRQRRINLPME